MSARKPAVAPLSFEPEPDPMAQAVEKLADAIAGFRTYRIGRATVTEPIVRRFAPPCPKCQSTDVSVSYHLADRSPTMSDRGYCRPQTATATPPWNTRASKHLHVTCRICGWDWTTGLQRPAR